MTVRVVPGTFSGPYDNNATGRGVSPGQVTVSDISTDGIDTDPDTKPGTAPADNLDASDDSVPTPVSFDVASVGDKVWLDIHNATGQFIADGQQQQDEPGIPGVKVNLMQGATLIDSVDTDSSGNYTFRYLPAGSYTVQIDPAEFLSGGTLYQWQVSPPNQGPDSTDSDGSAAHGAGVTLRASTQDARSTSASTDCPLQCDQDAHYRGAGADRLGGCLHHPGQQHRQAPDRGAAVAATNTVRCTCLMATVSRLWSYAVPSSTDTDNDGELDWSDVSRY